MACSTGRTGTAGNASLTQVWCSSLTSCVVAGSNTNVGRAIEVGTWSAGVLTLHEVGLPKTVNYPAVTGLSCHGMACVVVGDGEHRTAPNTWAYTSYTLTSRSGTPGKLSTLNKDMLAGVACVSESRCYAVGADAAYFGVLTTLISGRPTALHHVVTNLVSIACDGRACTAAGSRISAGHLVGSIASVLNGRQVSDREIGASGGFTDIARIGRFFAAVGPGRRTATDLTTG